MRITSEHPVLRLEIDSKRKNVIQKWNKLKTARQGIIQKAAMIGDWKVGAISGAVHCTLYIHSLIN